MPGINIAATGLVVSGGTTTGLIALMPSDFGDLSAVALSSFITFCMLGFLAFFVKNQNQLQRDTTKAQGEALRELAKEISVNTKESTKICLKVDSLIGTMQANPCLLGDAARIKAAQVAREVVEAARLAAVDVAAAAIHTAHEVKAEALAVEARAHEA